MGQKRSRAASRAWNLLRLALLWARKGGILKCRLMSELRHVNKHLKGLHRHRRIDAAAIYGERELSFDETPILRLGMIRPGSIRFKCPNIPCLKPAVIDFDYDLEDEVYVEEDEEEVIEHEYCDLNVEDDDERIDEKADEFIERFYQQMKMQRQVSYIEYKEMLNRGTS